MSEKCSATLNQVTLKDGRYTWHSCGRPAKFFYESANGRNVYVCGIHAKRRKSAKPVSSELAQPHETDSPSVAK